MSHMHHFLRFAKNNLYLELGASCLYSRTAEKSSSRKLGFRYTSLLLCLASRSSQGGRLKGA